MVPWHTVRSVYSMVKIFQKFRVKHHSQRNDVTYRLNCQCCPCYNSILFIICNQILTNYILRHLSWVNRQFLFCDLENLMKQYTVLSNFMNQNKISTVKKLQCLQAIQSFYRLNDHFWTFRSVLLQKQQKYAIIKILVVWTKLD